MWNILLAFTFTVISTFYTIFYFSPWTMDNTGDNEAPKDPGVCQQRYTEQDYEGNYWINSYERQELKCNAIETLF